MTYPLIGLLGGTFDPIHNGHIQIAQQLVDALTLTRIDFVPNQIPPHRKTPIANTQARVDMLELAIREIPHFSLNAIELEREGPSYTIDTLIQLRERHPDTALCWIIGSDALASLHHWHRYHELLEYCHFIVVNRPNYSCEYEPWLIQLLKQVEVTSADTLKTQQQGFIFQQTITPIDISATKLREQLKRGVDVSDQLPPLVLQYILRHHTYSMESPYDTE